MYVLSRHVPHVWPTVSGFYVSQLSRKCNLWDQRLCTTQTILSHTPRTERTSNQGRILSLPLPQRLHRSNVRASTLKFYLTLLSRFCRFWFSPKRRTCAGNFKIKQLDGNCDRRSVNHTCQWCIHLWMKFLLLISNDIQLSSSTNSKLNNIHQYPSRNLMHVFH